jgi:23S rRNA (adenine2503-C2)-methyltransferase
MDTDKYCKKRSSKNNTNILRVKMIEPQVVESKIDSSANFVFKDKESGYFESRFVQRSSDYYACYLSSHTGCNKGCSFCHLTATKQTMYRQATKAELLSQATRVNEYAKEQGLHETTRVQINFMARGEALDNKEIDGSFLCDLRTSFLPADHVRVNISTIMPKSIWNEDLVKRFAKYANAPILYYSMWSINEDWRKKNMPSALPVKEAYKKLLEYQKATGTIIKIHGAFIKDQNDGDDFKDMCRLLTDWSKELLFQFNIVRYNPYSEDSGKESEQLENIQEELWSNGISARLLERVGPDAACSCGQFIN